MPKPQMLENEKQNYKYKVQQILKEVHKNMLSAQRNGTPYNAKEELINRVTEMLKKSIKELSGLDISIDINNYGISYGTELSLKKIEAQEGLYDFVDGELRVIDSNDVRVIRDRIKTGQLSKTEGEKKLYDMGGWSKFYGKTIDEIIELKRADLAKNPSNAKLLNEQIEYLQNYKKRLESLDKNFAQLQSDLKSQLTEVQINIEASASALQQLTNSNKEIVEVKTQLHISLAFLAVGILTAAAGIAILTGLGAAVGIGASLAVGIPCIVAGGFTAIGSLIGTILNASDLDCLKEGNKWLSISDAQKTQSLCSTFITATENALEAINKSAPRIAPEVKSGLSTLTQIATDATALAQDTRSLARTTVLDSGKHPDNYDVTPGDPKELAKENRAMKEQMAEMKKTIDTLKENVVDLYKAVQLEKGVLTQGNAGVVPGL